MIRTPRMILRSLTEDDVDDVLRIFSDPVAMRFSITGLRDREATREWLREVIRRNEIHGQGFRAATLKSDGSYVGHAGLLPQEVEGESYLEIAYWFVRERWGQGLATEAACALRDYGLGVLKQRRLISLIVPENVASRRVAEKTGLELDRQVVWKNTNVLVYAIDADDTKS